MGVRPAVLDVAVWPDRSNAALHRSHVTLGGRMGRLPGMKSTRRRKSARERGYVAKTLYLLLESDNALKVLCQRRKCVENDVLRAIIDAELLREGLLFRPPHAGGGRGKAGR